jgi:predicted nucleotidyltransferase component of viral defense system
MVKKEIKNMAESVRAKLKNISRETKRDFDAVLLQYFQERFLYRISISGFRKKLILKGALLLMVKSLSPFRLTKDIDFMGIGIAGKPENIKSIFKNIADINYDDGVHFASGSIEATIIKEGAEYQGVRIKLEATMGSIRKGIQLDVGFGDVITGGPEEIDFPILLSFPAPKIKCYPFETIIAEKFQAIVWLNFQTSRMKDFFDILFLADINTFMSNRLTKALEATFKNRDTDKEQTGSIFTGEFKNDKIKQVQWSAFLKKNNLTSEPSFSVVVEKIQRFLEPLFDGSLEKEINYIWDKEKWMWTESSLLPS